MSYPLSRIEIAAYKASSDGFYWGPFPNGDKPNDLISTAVISLLSTGALTTQSRLNGALSIAVAGRGTITSGGLQKKWNPSIAYWQIDYNISLAAQFARMAALKAACPATRGFEFSWNWALLENPALVGGAAQYDGSWGTPASPTDYNNLRGFALLQTFLNEAARLGCQLMMSVRMLGGHSDGGDQNPTHFPSSFVPTYFQNSLYGPNTASTNGRWGAVWLNSYGGSNNPPAGTPNTGNGSAFTMYVRWWDSLTFPLYKALGVAYGAQFDSNQNLECVSWSSDEMIAATTTGINDAGFIAATCGSSSISATWRAAFPTTIVRNYVSYSGTLDTMDTVLAGSLALNTAIGGPDTANDSPNTSSNAVLNSRGIFRSVTAAWRWKGLTASVGNGGVVDPTAPVYVGQNIYMCEVEGEDLAHDNSTNTNYSDDGRFIGDGCFFNIVNEMNLLGAQYGIWYDNTDTTHNSMNRPAHIPLSSRITTVGAHPNLCDMVQSLATGTTVQGINLGVSLQNTTRPPGWT